MSIPVLSGIGNGISSGAGWVFNGGLSNALGFGNPYQGAPPAAQPNLAAYQPQTQGTQDALAALQGFLQQPGVSVDTSQSDQTRAQQQQLANLLLGAAQGQGPSAAQIQMGQGLDQALAQGRGLTQALAQQSGNPIAALQAGGGSQSLLQRQALGDSAQMRAQEQLAARQQLEQALSSQRYGDVATQAQQLQAGLGNRQIGVQGLNALAGGQQSLMQAQLQGTMGADQARMMAANQARQDYIQSRAMDFQNRRALMSTLLQTAGSVGSAAMGG